FDFGFARNGRRSSVQILCKQPIYSLCSKDFVRFAKFSLHLTSWFPHLMCLLSALFAVVFYGDFLMYFWHTLNSSKSKYEIVLVTLAHFCNFWWLAFCTYMITMWINCYLALSAYLILVRFRHTYAQLEKINAVLRSDQMQP